MEETGDMTWQAYNLQCVRCLIYPRYRTQENKARKIITVVRFNLDCLNFGCMHDMYDFLYFLNFEFVPYARFLWVTCNRLD